ncbi:hypothetical protein [Neomoorella mulderi]|uniref:hypothetical protein n=1 Tax=Neomoorella mulderi TaxID=202604 RepID=UPI000785F5C3|nr:hypothetical protein [Moorella mulderi]
MYWQYILGKKGGVAAVYIVWILENNLVIRVIVSRRKPWIGGFHLPSYLAAFCLLSAQIFYLYFNLFSVAKFGVFAGDGYSLTFLLLWLVLRQKQNLFYGFDKKIVLRAGNIDKLALLG